MPFAITLRLDPASAAAIEDLSRALAIENIDPPWVGYAPHVTLAIFSDDATVDLLREATRQLADHWRALPVSFNAIGVFPGSSSILWAAPVVTTALLVRRAGIHVALPSLPAHPHYRADTWVPHVTLSGPVQDAGRALAALLRVWQPVAGLLDRAELVRFDPVEVLQSHELPLRAASA